MYGEENIGIKYLRTGWDVWLFWLDEDKPLTMFTNETEAFTGFMYVCVHYSFIDLWIWGECLASFNS